MTNGTNEGSMCGFRSSASTLASWLSSYYFSEARCHEAEHHSELGWTPERVLSIPFTTRCLLRVNVTL